MTNIMSDKNGLLRQPSLHNIQSHPLVEPSKILLLSLHIKLGVMKNLVKAMDREDREFAFLLEKFPWISMEKLKAGIYDDPKKKKRTHVGSNV